MDIIDKEICLVIVHVENGYVSFVDKSSYIDYFNRNYDMLLSDDILVILNGGESIALNSEIICEMRWIRD